jgi:hypothetical protein
VTVIGFLITPFSLRLTLSTSSAWRSIVMFLWMMPIPPSRARAIAISLSVTVSIAARKEGDIEGDVLGEFGGFKETMIGRDFAVAGQEKHIVKSDALLQRFSRLFP